MKSHPLYTCGQYGEWSSSSSFQACQCEERTRAATDSDFKTGGWLSCQNAFSFSISTTEDLEQQRKTYSTAHSMARRIIQSRLTQFFPVASRTHRSRTSIQNPTEIRTPEIRSLPSQCRQLLECGYRAGSKRWILAGAIIPRYKSINLYMFCTWMHEVQRK